MLRMLVPRRPLLPLTRLASGAVSASRRPLLAPLSLGSWRLLSTTPARLLQTSRTRQQLATPPSSPSSSSSSSGNSEQAPQDTSLSGRLKHLIKTYGWYALAVYILISTVDFGVAFAAINVIGAEHVRALVARAKALIWTPDPSAEADAPVQEGGREGLLAMLALSYAVHKTLFLPVRIGLTAAATPPLVHWLRARGWAGSAGTRRVVLEMRDKMRDRRPSSSSTSHNRE